VSTYVLSVIPVLIGVYLLIGRGGFWQVSRHFAPPCSPRAPRRLVVLVPARNEATLIGAAVRSLARQTFEGEIQIVVIDDGSTDGTAEAATAAAGGLGALERLTVIRAAPLPHGWTGKLWALSQGVKVAAALNPDYLLFTDADIEHGHDSFASLVGTADAHGWDLVSHMAKLSTTTLSERLLIPAFVFFFFKLYPPRWIASPRSKIAAAAGGCILIRPQMLVRIGGLEAIRSQVIDDCALARAVKVAGGRVWLCLTRDTRSLRAYQSAAEIGAMISRTAFSQLGHSYLMLLGTLVGLFFTYTLPAVLLLTGDPVLVCLGAAAWVLMSICYWPMVRFYGLSPVWCLCLPVIALFYLGAVIHSAAQYARGRGGKWKGRVQDA
jgi:hopene-associated glycosyltransferase HpnB